MYFWRPAAPAPPPRQAPPAAVVGAHAHLGAISNYVDGLGTVVPVFTVNVTSRVDGELLNVYYQEGQMVKQGELLAQIDPRPYQAQLTQYQGQLARDEALLANAKLDLARYAELLPEHAIPEQLYATQQALVKQYEAAIQTDEGLIASAKLNIAYTRIVAPIAGRVGLRLVDPGNIVSANSSVLATITQISPTTVVFSIPEQQLPAVRRARAPGGRLPVYVYDSSMTTLLGTGRLETIDNAIDPTTGTVRLRAVFPNPNDALYANQFVNARLLLRERRNVVLVPNAAIQLNGTTPYVWVVQPEGTAANRQVVVGTEGPLESQIVSGVNPGEVVITQGVDRLSPGQRVNVQLSYNAPATAPGQAASAP